MNYFALAQETMQITKDGQYEVEGKTVQLPKEDIEEVIVYDPELGEEMSHVTKRANGAGRIIVTGEDSFEAAARYKNPLVMSFANALHPGGGFKMGSNAQEESLCRASTLYASIASEHGKLMYDYNASHPSKVASDFMLLSPNVCVFRDPQGELLAKPYTVGVISVTAPNRAGAAFRVRKATTAEAMEDRIRIMLSVAYQNNYRNLVLGAWGCGVFRNEAKDVAEHFRKVLIDEGYAKYFNEICFAIHRKPNKRESKNQRIFRLALTPDAEPEQKTETKKKKSKLPGKIHLPKVPSVKAAKEKHAAKKAAKAERAEHGEKNKKLRKRGKKAQQDKTPSKM